VKLRVAEVAQRQIARIEKYWFDQRPDAETLFADELTATFHAITTIRYAGSRWPTTRRPELRRILMPRSMNHLYFVVDIAGDTVRVLAVWGARKGRTPRL
jgi:plasmid stabilization system protein ParE